MKPSVSIVISTRNRREDVLASIESCLAQDYDQLEVIVYDDASTDGTSDAVRDRFPEVRLFRSEIQVGLIVLRNRGFTDSRAKFVFSIDDDAYFTDSMTVGRTVELFERYPQAAAIALPHVEPNADRGSGRMPPCDVGTPLRGYIGCAHALRREVVVQLGQYREFLVHQGEERDLSLRILDAGWSIIYGDTSPIVHTVSPVRDQTRISYYGYRNTLLITWLNVPHPYTLPRMLVDSAQLFRYRLSAAIVLPRLQAILRGWLSCLKYHDARRPIRRDAYRLYRSLPGHGAAAPADGLMSAALRRQEVTRRVSGPTADREVKR